MSFYKLFGYPTGLGALLVRRDVSSLLRKSYYGGGTVSSLTADSLFLSPSPSYPVHTWLEDGTPHYQGIIALQFGFQELNERGGMKQIQNYSHTLSFSLADELMALKHSNGTPMCKVFGRHEEEKSVSDRLLVQGPVVTFIVWWKDGRPVSSEWVGVLARRYGILLRTGCFCSIGGCQEALSLTAQDVKVNFMLGRHCGRDSEKEVREAASTEEWLTASDFTDIVRGRHTGAVRASLGGTSKPSDCTALVQFLRHHFLDQVSPEGRPPLSTDTPSPSPPSALHSLVSMSCSMTANLPERKEETESKAAVEHSLPRLLAIVIYPIKSCAGVRVGRWPLSAHGLLLDRQWAVVSSPTFSSDTVSTESRPLSRMARVLTLRFCPRLALLRPTLQLSEETMTLTAPDMESISLSLNLTGAESGEEIKVVVCGRGKTHTLSATSVSEVVDDWVSRFIGRACQLVRLIGSTDEEDATPVYERDQSFANSSVSCSDAQLLAVSIESLTELQQFLGKERDKDLISSVGLDNFRPNLVLQGVHSVNNENHHNHELERDIVGSGSFLSDGDRPCFEYDRWNQLLVNTVTSEGEAVNIVLDAVSSCERCGAVNVNPVTGERLSTKNGGILESLADMLLSSHEDASQPFKSISFGVLCKWSSDRVSREVGGDPTPLWISEGSSITLADNVLT